MGNRHDGHHEFATVIIESGHEGLEDNIGIKFELVGSFEPKRLGPRVVIVGIGLIVNPLGIKKDRRRCLHSLNVSLVGKASCREYI
jgi:hypothetical protein